MVRMLVVAEHQYAGRRLRVGDHYDCEEKHVDVMTKLGWARRDDGDPAPAVEELQKLPLEYDTRVMTARTTRAMRPRQK